MYVIVVDFTLHPRHAASFMPLMLENARISLDTEPGCRRFDVCHDPAQLESVMLYEIYADRAAFDAHLASAHFKAFDAATREMVAAKAVRSYELMSMTNP